MKEKQAFKTGTAPHECESNIYFQSLSKSFIMFQSISIMFQTLLNSFNKFHMVSILLGTLASKNTLQIPSKIMCFQYIFKTYMQFTKTFQKILLKGSKISSRSSIRLFFQVDLNPGLSNPSRLVFVAVTKMSVDQFLLYIMIVKSRPISSHQVSPKFDRFYIYLLSRQNN